MVVASLWTDALWWVLVVVAFAAAVVAAFIYVAPVVFLIGAPPWMALRWVRRARRILQDVGNDYDDDGYRFYTDEQGNRYYDPGIFWHNKVVPGVESPRAYLVYGDDICAFVNPYGRVVYCKRDGTLFSELPKLARRVPVEPYDLPESAWMPQEIPAAE